MNKYEYVLVKWVHCIVDLSQYNPFIMHITFFCEEFDCKILYSMNKQGRCISSGKLTCHFLKKQIILYLFFSFIFRIWLVKQFNMRTLYIFFEIKQNNDRSNWQFYWQMENILSFNYHKWYILLVCDGKSLFLTTQQD